MAWTYICVRIWAFIIVNKEDTRESLWSIAGWDSADFTQPDAYLIQFSNVHHYHDIDQIQHFNSISYKKRNNIILFYFYRMIKKYKIYYTRNISFKSPVTFLGNRNWKHK